MLPFSCPNHTFLTQTLQNNLPKGLHHSMLLETQAPYLACGVLILLITSYCMVLLLQQPNRSKLLATIPEEGLRQQIQDQNSLPV